MVYEEEILSFDELFRELSILDMDAGLRIETQYNGKDSYIFITRNGEGYALAIYDTVQKGKLKVPKERLAFRQFPNNEQLSEFLKQILDSSFRCFKY
jgi:hypothetical protein